MTDFRCQVWRFWSLVTTHHNNQKKEYDAITSSKLHYITAAQNHTDGSETVYLWRRYISDNIVIINCFGHDNHLRKTKSDTVTALPHIISLIDYEIKKE